jgi:hypothetical protein
MNNSGDLERKVDDATDGHPVATGAGAAVGGVAGGVLGAAAAGAAVGGITGPVGAAIGAAEDSFWRENYTSRPYVTAGSTYDEYGPAYRYGVDAYSRYPDRKFDDLDVDLSRDWGTSRGTSTLEWEHAKHATRDAWHRVSDTVERATPGDSDRDGK